MATNKTCHIEVIEVNDIPDVIEFLRTFFYKDEPVNKSLGLEYNQEIGDFTMSTITENCSFKAVDTNGKIIGCCINGVANKPASGASQSLYSDSIQDPTMKTLVQLFEYIDAHFNMFDLYPNIDKYMDVKVVSVDGNYRGQGIAHALIEKTMEYTKVHGIPLISMMCTSNFSARLCEKVGFTRTYALSYDDYIVDGHRPIQPDKPHEAVQIWVAEIQ